MYLIKFQTKSEQMIVVNYHLLALNHQFDDIEHPEF